MLPFYFYSSITKKQRLAVFLDRIAAPHELYRKNLKGNNTERAGSLCVNKFNLFIEELL